MDLTRRDVLLGSLKTVAVAQFLRLSLGTKAYASAIAPEIEPWLTDLGAIARDFRSDSLTLPQWHTAIETLNRRVPMQDLITYVKLEEVKPRLLALGRGEHFEKFELPLISGLGRPFTSSVFSVTPGEHVPPHGHNNLVTAHMLLKGRLHTRTFARLHDEKGRITVKPSRDEMSDIGMTVTMSEEIDNIHWFQAQREQAFSFQISATVPNTKDYLNGAEHDGRVYLDLRGKPRGDGTIEAPVINDAESHRLYSA